MAQYDVYRLPDGAGYLLDIQSDFHDAIDTRVVVPLLPVGDAPIPSLHLNPEFRIGEDRVVMLTQSLAAIRRSELRTALLSLAVERDRITRALDRLLNGV